MMLNRVLKLKCKKIEFLFYVAFFLLCVYRILKSSSLEFIDYGATYIIIIGLLVGRILTMHIRVNSIFTMCVLCPLAGLCLLYTGDPIIPVVVMMLLASKDIRFDKIVRLSFIITAVLVSALLVLAVLGVVEDYTSIRYLNGVKVICHGAGFNHSSKLPTYYCFLFLEWFYLQRRKIGIIKYVLWMTIGYVIFLFCAERLRFYNLIIAIIIGLIFQATKNKFQEIKKLLSIVIYPILALLTNCLGYIYDATNPILYGLNILISNRLYLTKFAFDHYGITLFGQNVKMGEEAIRVNGNLEYFYIDSGYVYIFVIYGIIIGTLILMAYCMGSYKSFKLGDTKLFVWFICMAFDAVIGNQMLSIWSIPLLFVPFCSCNQYILTAKYKEVDSDKKKSKRDTREAYNNL